MMNVSDGLPLLPVVGTLVGPPPTSIWEVIHVAELSPECVFLIGVLALLLKNVKATLSAQTPSARQAVRQRLRLLRHLGVIAFVLDSLRTLCTIISGFPFSPPWFADPIVKVVGTVVPAFVFVVAGLLILLVALTGAFACECLLVSRNLLSQDQTQPPAVE